MVATGLGGQIVGEMFAPILIPSKLLEMFGPDRNGRNGQTIGHGEMARLSSLVSFLPNDKSKILEMFGPDRNGRNGQTVGHGEVARLSSLVSFLPNDKTSRLAKK